MTTKYETEQMLKQAIETNGKLSKHIENLWEEIGEKQNTLYELKGEIYDLKSDNKDLVKKCKEFIQKTDAVEKAQFQKDWLENFNHRKVDN
tara:strand:- start:1495 stop:1767 length:273 start_codon:yes stop_codon:yes gene_type:complete